MKLTITKSKLMRILDIVNLANSTNSIDHTMGCACLEASQKTNRLRMYKNGRLFAYAIDECNSVSESGSIYVNVGIMSSVVSKLPEGDIDLDLYDNTLGVKHGSTSLKLPVVADMNIELIEPDDQDNDTLVEIQSKRFQLAINRVKGMNDPHHSQEALKAYYMQFGDNALSITTATQKGFSRFICPCTIKQKNHDLKLLPYQNGIQDIYKFSSLAGETLKFRVHDSSLIVLGGSAYLSLNYINASPAPIDRIILKPDEVEWSITFEGCDFKSKLNVITSIPQLNEVKFEYNNGELKMSGTSPTYGSISDSIKANGGDLEPMQWRIANDMLKQNIATFPECTVKMVSLYDEKRIIKQFEYEGNIIGMMPLLYLKQPAKPKE